MKRIITLLGLATILLAPAWSLAGQASAVDIFTNTCDTSVYNATDVCKDVQAQKGSKTNPIIGTLKVAIDIISLAVGIASTAGIIVSALRMVTAGGSSEKVAGARSGLIFSLIGIAVTLMSQTIVFFVLDKIQ